MKDADKTRDVLLAELLALRQRVARLETDAATRRSSAEPAERERMEGALRESEARNRALVRAIPDAMFRMDRDGVYLDFVPAKGFETLYPPESFLGRPVHEFLPASIAEAAMQSIEAALRTNEVQRFEYDLSLGGVLRHYEVRVVPDEPNSILAIVREITEHRQAEEALRRAEQRYRDLFEQAPVMYLITENRAGVPFVTDCNDFFLKTLGYRREEVLAHPLTDFYTSASGRSLLEGGGYQHALAGTFIAEERQLRTRQGRVIETLLNAVPEVDAAGRVRGTRAMYVDITERKRAEERLEAFFSQSLDGCFFMMLDEPVRWDDAADKEAVLDYVFTHQRITEINDAMLAQYGAHRDDFLGLTPADFFEHDPAHGRAVWTAFFDEGRIRLETDERKHDGTPMWIEGEYVCLYDEQGRIKGHFGIQREITGRKQAQAERERLIEELEATNIELERFTYTVSHDLKSPLVTVKGFLGLLEKDAASGDTDRLHEDIAQIHAALNKMQRLLDELLALSRIGRVVNPPEAVSLTELAGEAAALVAGQIETRGVTVEIAPQMPVVSVDRVRLREVFQNLLDNAVKYMGDQAAPRIVVGARQEGAEVVCSVEDNGIGIAPRYHEKVFDLFERLDAHGEGTGIGLAAARRIIEVHRGRLWVESDGPGHGATFRFTLPLGKGRGKG